MILQSRSTNYDISAHLSNIRQLLNDEFHLNISLLIKLLKKVSPIPNNVLFEQRLTMRGFREHVYISMSYELHKRSEDNCDGIYVIKLTYKNRVLDSVSLNSLSSLGYNKQVYHLFILDFVQNLASDGERSKYFKKYALSYKGDPLDNYFALDD